MSTKILVMPSSRPSADDSADAPRLDYQLLAERLDAEIRYPPSEGGFMARVEAKTASDLRQAWQVARLAGVGTYVSLSEKVGLPLAMTAGRGSRHILLAHYLTSERKRAFQKVTHYLQRFDRIVVLCRTQERYLRDELGLPQDRVRFLYDKVDSVFWHPLPEDSRRTGVLCVGKEQRDYSTLLATARLLPDTPFTIVASSLWSHRQDTISEALPSNVTLKQNLSWADLRALYHHSALVVVPIYSGIDYAAGVNGVLEAMAMAKPVIVSDTPGLADYTDSGENAMRVPPADPAALADSIENLLGNPEAASRLARNARQVVDAGRNLDRYVEKLARIVREVSP